MPKYSLEKNNTNSNLSSGFVLFTNGGNEVSDIELYGYGKESKYVVKIEL